MSAVPRSSLSITICVLTILTSSCTKSRSRHSPHGRPAMAESMRFEYGVYLLPGSHHSPDPMLVVRQALGRYPDLRVVDEIAESSQGRVVHAYMQNDVPLKYAPPSLKALQYSGEGISREQRLLLQASQRAVIIDFAHPRPQVWAALRDADAVVEEIARRTGGLVWDEETRQVFSPDEWHRRRLGSWKAEIPDVSSQTIIHQYSTGESVRSISLGMAKMGLPDVVVENPVSSSDAHVGDLINVFSQSMAEGAPIPEADGDFRLVLRDIKNTNVRDEEMKTLKPNAIGTACLTLKPGKWEEGDPKNRLIQLGAEEYRGKDESEKQEAMLDAFFGWEDAVRRITHSPELLAASEQARAKLPELQKAFAAGLHPGEYIQLKAPFQAPNGNREWMWVEVRSWQGNRIKGILENEPVDVPNLHTGQEVEIDQADVFDYIRQSGNNREGNETGKIIEKLDQNPEKEKQRNLEIPACGAGE